MRPGLSLLFVCLLCLTFPVRASSPAAGAAAVAIRTGNASNAVALATQALSEPGLSAHDRAMVLIDRGLAHAMLAEHDAALIDFTEAISARALSAQERVRALFARGVTLDEMGRTDDAIGDYSAALRLDPANAAALNNRGNAYRRAGRLDDACSDYERSIAAGNLHGEYPNYGLGQIAEAQGQIEAARAFYSAALAVNPQFSLAQERLAALATSVAPPDTTPIVLRPPGQGVIHLRPPKRARRPDPPKATSSPVPDLKPALGETGAPGQFIQLGAWRNEADAADAWNHIVSMSGNLLAGLTPQVAPVDLPGKGRYYRLRAGPVGEGGAATLCSSLRQRKLECVVVTS